MLMMNSIIYFLSYKIFKKVIRKFFKYIDLKNFLAKIYRIKYLQKKLFILYKIGIIVISI